MRFIEKERWEAYHKAREERHQQVLDEIAETFEEFTSVFSQDLQLDFLAATHEDPEIRKGGLAVFRKRFGNMKVVNQFFRTYLRARGEPETISSTKIEHSGSVATYGELESVKKAKSVEEAREMGENQGE